MRSFGIIVLYTIFSFGICHGAEQLKCYVCNSNFQKCGLGANFDPSFHDFTYCSGTCMKITISPGDFIIRTCSTLFNSLTSPTNLSITNPEAQQCYISSFTEIDLSDTVPAYYCYCNDRDGCNRATNLHLQSSVLILFVFISYIVNCF